MFLILRIFSLSWSETTNSVTRSHENIYNILCLYFFNPNNKEYLLSFAFRGERRMWEKDTVNIK